MCPTECTDSSSRLVFAPARNCWTFSFRADKQKVTFLRNLESPSSFPIFRFFFFRTHNSRINRCHTLQLRVNLYEHLTVRFPTGARHSFPQRVQTGQPTSSSVDTVGYFAGGKVAGGRRSRYSDSLRAGQSRDRISVGGEIFRPRPHRPWGPPSLLYDGYRVFPGSKAAGARG
jgi:hypothetical protein